MFAIAAALAATLLAETSPWPVPPSPGSAPQVAAPRTITIAFWKVQWFPGRRPKATRAEERQQINAVHNDIPQLHADIIGLEEMRDFAHAAVAVQPLPGFKVDVCANFPPREGQAEAQEVAIASRMQPLNAWAEEFKRAGALTPPRGFAFVAYEIAPRQLLLVYDVHLKSNRGDISEDIQIREESVRQLRSHMNSMQAAYGKLGGISWFIGGDFNTATEDKRFAVETSLRSLVNNGFLWAWQNIPASSRQTLPPSRDFPAACFDHIFYRGATLREARVVSTSAQSSDHRAIVATFDLPLAPR